MKLVKIKSESTHKTKDGKEVPNWYFALKNEKGKIIPIKPLFKDGYKLLDYEVEEYVR